MDLAKRQLFAKEAPKTEIGAKLADFGVKLARNWRFGKEIQMRKKIFKGCKCIKKTVSKADGVCRTYDALQLAALDELERDGEIAEIRCNVVLEGSQWDAYRKIGELLGRSASTICREVKLQLNRCRESRCSPGSKNAAETGAFFKLYIG